MTEAFRDGVARITALVQAAALPDDVRHTALWCLEQLPKLYEKFCQTHESRYGEEILRLEQGVLRKLADSAAPSATGPAVGEAVLDNLRLLHEQFGLPVLDPKVPRAAPARSRKAS